MKRLPPDKRNKLIIVIIGTVTLLGLIYYFLIAPQKASSGKLAEEIRAQQDRLTNIRNSIKDTEGITARLTEATLQLTRAEQDVATGDVYAWTYDLIRRFKASHRVEIPTLSQPALADVDLLPGFPYRQVRVQLSGTGFYHEIGKFISDFENTFPHTRMVNLVIEPSNLTGSGTTEKLAFRVDVVCLVKPNNS